MNLTVDQYKHMRLSGMTDQAILQALHYSPNYKRKLQQWKRENGVKVGKDKTQLLDPNEVFAYLQNHSMMKTALHFGVDVQALYRWEKGQRER